MNRLRARAFALGAGLAVAASVMAPIPASASETWYFNSLNCGSSLILSSAKVNGTVNHIHVQGPNQRSRNFVLANGPYVWTYYNPGWTSISGGRLQGSNDIQAGGRSCDY